MCAENKNVSPREIEKIKERMRNHNLFFNYLVVMANENI
jgi:hypothetical protein